jgi:hypothetical protein
MRSLLLQKKARALTKTCLHPLGKLLQQPRQVHSLNWSSATSIFPDATWPSRARLKAHAISRPALFVEFQKRNPSERLCSRRWLPSPGPNLDHSRSQSLIQTPLGDTAMSDSSSHDVAQLFARLTVLERVVGMMVREAMIKAGKGPQDILAYGEAVKAFFNDRTPEGAELTDAADKFFSGIASDIGSQESQ